MIESVYQFFDRIGYTHPIHPPLTHMLIGLVVGAFLFALIAILFKRPMLAQTARHCIILAYLFLFPMACLGYMDWQHYFKGAWLTPIRIKLILTGVFLVLITLGIVLGRRNAGARAVLVVYGLCFVTLIGLGYYGGHLAFSCMSPTAPWEFETGARTYSSECASCHPQGNNIITPDIPLRGSNQLASFKSFLAYLRNPKRPDGSDGDMPSFSAGEITDKESRELYEYIVNVLEQRRDWPRKH